MPLVVSAWAFSFSFSLFFHSTLPWREKKTKGLTEDTFEMHKSEVFEHLELRVGE